MSDCNDSLRLELASDDLLNKLVSSVVNVGSCFIQNNNFSPIEQDSTKTEQLFLSHRKDL